jgi:hypothetical protein
MGPFGFNSFALTKLIDLSYTFMITYKENEIFPNRYFFNKKSKTQPTMFLN